MLYNSLQDNYMIRQRPSSPVAPVACVNTMLRAHHASSLIALCCCVLVASADITPVYESSLSNGPLTRDAAFHSTDEGRQRQNLIFDQDDTNLILDQDRSNSRFLQVANDFPQQHQSPYAFQHHQSQQPSFVSSRTFQNGGGGSSLGVTWRNRILPGGGAHSIASSQNHKQENRILSPQLLSSLGYPTLHINDINSGNVVRTIPYGANTRFQEQQKGHRYANYDDDDISNNSLLPSPAPNRDRLGTALLNSVPEGERGLMVSPRVVERDNKYDGDSHQIFYDDITNDDSTAMKQQNYYTPKNEIFQGSSDNVADVRLFKAIIKLLPKTRFSGSASEVVKNLLLRSGDSNARRFQYSSPVAPGTIGKRAGGDDFGDIDSHPEDGRVEDPPPSSGGQQPEVEDPLEQLQEPVEKRGLYKTLAGVSGWWSNRYPRHRPKVNRRAPESKHYTCLKECIMGGQLHPIQCHTLC